MSNNTVPTLGERRVGLSFNPSQNSSVAKIKRAAADFIDFLTAIKNEEVSKTYDTLSPEQLKEQNGEFLRAISLAQTHIETASMFAVKAATMEFKG